MSTLLLVGWVDEESCLLVDGFCNPKLVMLTFPRVLVGSYQVILYFFNLLSFVLQ